MKTDSTFGFSILDGTSHRDIASIEAFLHRPAFDPEAERVAFDLLRDIQRRGETAIVEAVERFDGIRLSPESLRIPAIDLTGASKRVSPEFRRATRYAERRIRAFARAGMRRDWQIRDTEGAILGERFIPLDRVGVYVPGGVAPLASTVLMTVTLARVAGVPEIVVCTPPSRLDGGIPPALMHAMQVAGATEVYRVGGIQAIGLMAFGTRRVAPVQKIVGPGGAYVTAAKRQVYGHVALDLVAGPSEIAILADATAKPEWVAADLLSQIEHGTGHEKALLVTDCRALAVAVTKALDRQSATLSRHAFVQTVMRRNIMLVVTPSLSEGMTLCNRFAPEHFELMVAQPMRWVRRVRSAGAVFVGPWTPEAVGDFVAGPSHVLPTGGAARMFSGLTVDDFRRRTSVVRFSRAALRAASPAVAAFAEMEGLDGHGRSAAIRFED